MKTISTHIKILATTLLFGLFVLCASAQRGRDKLVFAEGFDHGLLEQLIRHKLNEHRASYNYHELKPEGLLEQAAQDQAAYMARVRKETLLQEDGPETTHERLQEHGGSGQGAELVEKQNISRPGDTLTYGELADNICNNWFGAARYEELFNNPAYTLVGISARLGEKRRKAVFVSVVLGNYNSYTGNPAARDEIEPTYEDDDHGLEPYNKLACKNPSAPDILYAVQNSLKVEGREIILEFDRGKDLDTWLQDKDDALAVDVLMQSQYPCGQKNILDYRLPGKGILLDPVDAGDIEEQLKPKGTSRAVLGELPEELAQGPYELNLVAIKQEHFCQYIADAPETLQEDKSSPEEITDNGMVLSDTIIFHHHLGLLDLPEQKDGEMVFIVPFAKGKAEYQEKDILPIIESLEAPGFSIKSIKIHAYSSLEGQHEANKALQQKRAHSIARVLKDFGQDISSVEVQTGYNWKDFVRDISGTPWDSLTWRGMKKARQSINQYRLADELEPILQKHRYARVQMEVTYHLPDEASKNKYILYKFNEAVQNNDRETALVWQKLIFKLLRQGRMPEPALKKMKIKQDSYFAGIRMNQCWMRWQVQGQDSISPAMRDTLLALYELNPANNYIIFNKLRSDLYYSTLERASDIVDYEKELNRLVMNSFRMDVTRQLALDFYLTLSLTLEDRSPEHQRALDKLKDYARYGDNIQQAQSIARVFINIGRYGFAADILEPYLETGGKDIALLYLHAAGYDVWRLYTPSYALAIKKVFEAEGRKACRLFEPGKGLSLRALENPAVKDLYCTECTP